MNPIYKPSDLLSMAERGILEYEGINISEIVMAALSVVSVEFEDSHKSKLDEAYERGYDEGQADQAAEIRAVIG